MSTAPDAHGRIEPRFDSGGVPLEEISFLQRGRPVPASLRLRGVTYALIAFYIAFNLYRAVANGLGAPELLGTIFGGLVGVMIPVWFSGWWEENKTQRTRYKLAAWAAAVHLSVQVLGVLSVRHDRRNSWWTRALR